MKLYEYMAKELLGKNGIPVPRGEVAGSTAEAKEKTEEMDTPVALKSQVLSGGRGKAGGIKFAESSEEISEAAEELLDMKIKGYKVDTILIEEKLQIDQELYLSIAIDAVNKKPVVIASKEGGVDIEEVPEDKIVKRHVDPKWGVEPYISREIVDELDLDQIVSKQVTKIMKKIYDLFKNYDAELVEINPLVVSGEKVVAADAKINIDEDALFRHSDLPKISDKTALEKKVEEMGLSFVELEGDIAIMANGAGMAMATLDVIDYFGGSAANFLDAGGGASVKLTKQALEVLLSTNPNAVLINIFGGITRCDDVANALIQVKNETGIPVPLVIRLMGTNDEKGVEMLQENGIKAYRMMDEAAKKVVELAKGHKEGGKKGKKGADVDGNSG
ncbi:ADP-forming succinate--CoA ligase subunit beta [Natranaerofaba carboxydovora]|uniref:ADP-forming succinate--CoA ligase subunit beta n=1 Tax=Natranaerofaba carboxydovora TaxID=2742683 RepID=UPI001F1489D9|nr:ADP-forming succinate--CoA ligase subunit beta [Natranaerofaba carboxydovora]UMZ74089.1 Succinate--CoA ligase [GDP-forming] subunit beta [Natranaerofaba carboxydovora]